MVGRAGLIELRDDGGRRDLAEEVATYVRDLILSGQVRPGDFLRVEPIANAVGLSNTPVRQGLLALSGEGFVELVPRRGFVVAPLSKQDVHDLFWTQATLSGELAARAALNITPGQITRLATINGRFDEAVEAGDRDAIAYLGHEFHREVNLASGSRRLTRLLGSVVRHLPNRFYASFESRVAATRDDHRKLAAALRDRQASKARSLAEKHLLKGGDAVIEMLAARGFWADE